MKKIFFLSVALFAAIVSSCRKQETACSETSSAGEGTLTLSVHYDDIRTKADPNANESTLDTVQVLFMHAEGASKDELYRYYSLSAEELAAGKCTVKNLKVGKYNIRVVANGPDLRNIRSLSELGDTVIELGAYNSPSGNFIMYGEADNVEVKTDATVTCSVGLDRLVSRVTLSKIKNNLPEAYGAMTVNYVILSNVVGNQTFLGTASPVTWYNRDGRSDETPRDSANIIGTGSHKASCGELTFKELADTVALGDSIVTPVYFYGYPNSSVRKGDGFESPWNVKATALDISISFNGKTYWYNVPIIWEKSPSVFAGMERNCNYDVQVKISGEGEDEPGKFTRKGAVTVSVTVKDWTDVSVPEMEI